MKLIKTKIDGPKIIKSKILYDKRGYLKEIFKSNILNSPNFPFDLISCSKKNVLRGLHIQLKKPQAKIITVSLGKILDVAVDLRKHSKTFGEYVSITISDKDDFSFYIPEGFAHGFVCLSQKCIINYKLSNYRHPQSERTLMWNDPDLNIEWIIKKPIMSNKDKKLGLRLKDFY